MSQPVKLYFDIINQSSRALYILLAASKIPYEAVPISVLKGMFFKLIIQKLKRDFLYKNKICG